MNPSQSAAVLASVETKWAERFETLQAEVARLTAQLLRTPEYLCGAGEQCGLCLECAMTAQDTALQAAQAEVEALKRDELRMDWLDKKNPYRWANKYVGETYRMKVDAAMKKEATTSKDQKQ